MSSELQLTAREQERILTLVASFEIESNDIPALRDAIEYDVKRYIEKRLRNRKFDMDTDAYERMRNCYHLTLLRVKNERSGEWSFVWECADCGAQVMATTIEMRMTA